MTEIITSGYPNAIATSNFAFCDRPRVKKEPEQTLWDRLQQRCQEKWPGRFDTDKGAPQEFLGSLIGKTQESAIKWKNGGLPRMNNAVKLALALDVCTEWLLTGRGPKFCTEPQNVLLENTIEIASRLQEHELMDLLDYAKYIETGKTGRHKKP